MFFFMLSLSMALLACLRGWFPWAFLVFAIPLVVPELMTHGFNLGGQLAFPVLGVEGGGLSLGGLLLMCLVPLD